MSKKGPARKPASGGKAGKAPKGAAGSSSGGSGRSGPAQGWGRKTGGNAGKSPGKNKPDKPPK